MDQPTSETLTVEQGPGISFQLAGSRIGLAVKAISKFIRVTHCDGTDRCSVGFFNDTLLWAQRLESRKTDIISCLNRADVCGGTRLYDSLCDSVDHLLEHGDRSRPWIIVAITHEDDNASTRSANECGDHILEEYAMMENSSIFVISVGSCTEYHGLSGMAERGCLHHVPVPSFSQLEDALMRISFGKIGSIPSAMDYVVIVSISASMGLTGVSTRPSQQKVSTRPRSRLGLPNPELAARVSHSSSQGNTGSASSSTAGATSVRIRELSNGSLHPDDRQIFREFASDNYPGINSSWDEEEIEFLVLVESRARCIVGLLVMLPYDGDKVHIRLMVVDKGYRKRGLGKMMLTHVAAKYHDKKVTLNVAYDRLDLLEFYLDKRYARLDDASTKHKVLILSLDHLSIFSRMPLPK